MKMREALNIERVPFEEKYKSALTRGGDKSDPYLTTLEHVFASRSNGRCDGTLVTRVRGTGDECRREAMTRQRRDRYTNHHTDTH